MADDTVHARQAAQRRDVEVGVGERDRGRRAERRRRSAAGVPSATTRPRCIITMRSQSRSASSTSWVTSTTVVPAVPDPADDVPGVAPADGVEVLGQLVEEHQLGPADERQRHEQALALAAGQGAEGSLPEARRAATPRPARRGAGARDAATRRTRAPRRPACGRAGRRPGAGRRSAGAAGRPRGRVEARAPDAEPPSARRRPWRISTVVVLPAPFVPSRPNSSPSSTENDTPWRTGGEP